MEVLLAFGLGLLIASNVSFIRKLLSFEEFFWGMMRGLEKGEEMKKKWSRKVKKEEGVVEVRGEANRKIEKRRGMRGGVSRSEQRKWEEKK